MHSSFSPYNSLTSQVFILHDRSGGLVGSMVKNLRTKNVHRITCCQSSLFIKRQWLFIRTLLLPAWAQKRVFGYILFYQCFTVLCLLVLELCFVSYKQGSVTDGSLINNVQKQLCNNLKTVVEHQACIETDKCHWDITLRYPFIT